MTKRIWEARTGTSVEKRLRDVSVTPIFVCGVATSIGGGSAARQVHELGFDVALAIDAATDLSADAHANSAAGIFAGLGETGTTADTAALLQPAA